MCFVCVSVCVCWEPLLVNIYQLKWASFKRRSCYSRCSRWHGDIYCHSERKREAALSRVWRSRALKRLIKAKHWDLYLPSRSFWIRSVNIMGVYDEQKKKKRNEECSLKSHFLPVCYLLLLKDAFVYIFPFAHKVWMSDFIWSIRQTKHCLCFIFCFVFWCEHHNNIMTYNIEYLEI